MCRSAHTKIWLGGLQFKILGMQTSEKAALACQQYPAASVVPTYIYGIMDRGSFYIHLSFS